MRVASLLLALAVSAPAQTFTLQQVMSAPFTTSLTAAPLGDTFAWITNAEGRRNLWIDTVGQPARQLTHYTLDDGQDVDDPAFSPDARWIAYTRGGHGEGVEHPVPNPAHIVPNVDQQVFVVATEGNAEPKLIGAGHAPAFSPKSKLLAFLRSGQIWTIDLAAADAKPTQLFQLRGHQSNLRWSPDGAALAFVSSRGDHALIGVYRFDTQAVVFIDPGTSQDSDPAWSPDSTRIAFIRNPTDFDKYENRWLHTGSPWSIRIADARTGAGRELWKADAGTGSLFREIAGKNNLIFTPNRIVFPWEHDGWLHLYSVEASSGCPIKPPHTPRHFDRSFAASSPDAAEKSAVAVRNANLSREAQPEEEGALAPGSCSAGQARLLTPGFYEVEHAAYDATTNTVVYSSNNLASMPPALIGRSDPAWEYDTDRRHLWRLPLDTSTPRSITKGEGIEVWPAISANGTLAFLKSDAHIPIHPATLDGDLAPQLIPKDFPADKLVTPQQVIFPATDGLQIHGQIFLPTPGTENHAAIVFVHGGSRRQMYLGWHPMEYYSNTYAMNQYLCALGYVVLSVNYRSGIGYGMLFRQADGYGFNGASEYRDILGAAKYLRTRPGVDPKRIGIYGGSYGGFLTALALARDSAIFAAGADFHGVHDWVAEMGLSHTSDESTPDRVDHRHHMAQTAWASSPMAALSTWKSPVLLVQGDDDRNVAFAQTVRLANALREQGVPVEEKIYPDEVHDFLLHRHWIETFNLTTNFFNRNLSSKK